MNKDSSGKANRSRGGRNGTAPSYRRLQDDLLTQISQGTLSPGAQIPTEKELVERYGVSITTVRRAVSELCTAGMLVRQQGRGTFVRQPRRLIGLVCPYPGLSWAPMIEALREQLRSTTSSLRTYCYTWASADAFLEEARACSDENDGMIVFLPYLDTDPVKQFFESLASSGYPFLFVEKPPFFDSPAPLITVDYKAGFARLVARVTRNSQTPAVLVDPSHPTGKGLIEACRDARIREELIVRGPFFGDQGAVAIAVRQLLSAAVKPDIVVCPSSKVAVAVALLLRGEGVHQDDMEVTAAGNVGQLSGLGEPMWVLELPRAAIGREAAQGITKLLRGEDSGLGVQLPPRLTFVDAAPAMARSPEATGMTTGPRLVSADLWSAGGPSQ